MTILKIILYCKTSCLLQFVMLTEITSCLFICFVQLSVLTATSVFKNSYLERTHLYNFFLYKKTAKNIHITCTLHTYILEYEQRESSKRNNNGAYKHKNKLFIHTRQGKGSMGKHLATTSHFSLEISKKRE